MHLRAMGNRVRILVASLAGLVLAGGLLLQAEPVARSLARMRAAVFQASPPLPDEAMSPDEPSPVPNPEGEGKLAPPGDEVLGGEGVEGGETVEGGEAVSPGSAVTGENSGLSSGPTTPQPPTGSEPSMPPPGPTPPPEAGEEAAAASEDELHDRIAEMEARLAELEGNQSAEIAAAEARIAELEDELDELNGRGVFLEQNRSERIERLRSGMEGIQFAEGNLAVGSSDLDGDLDQIAAELGGAAADAARYAGEDEAGLATRAQASVQAAREAIARGDLYAARMSLGYALAQARAAQAAAEAGSQDLFR